MSGGSGGGLASQGLSGGEQRHWKKGPEGQLMNSGPCPCSQCGAGRQVEPRVGECSNQPCSNGLVSI